MTPVERGIFLANPALLRTNQRRKREPNHRITTLFHVQKKVVAYRANAVLKYDAGLNEAELQTKTHSMTALRRYYETCAARATADLLRRNTTHVA